MSRFLVGGNRLPLDAEANVDVPQAMKDYGLTCYEVAGGHGFNMSTPKLRYIRNNSEELDIAITIHGMYSSSMMSTAKPNYTKLFNYLDDGMYYAEQLGGNKVVVHPGGKMEPDEDYQLGRTIWTLEHVLSFSKRDRSTIYLETMDGRNFGTFSQLMTIGEQLGTRVCVDFTHLWARAVGSSKQFGKKEVRSILRELERTDWKWDCYFHISGATVSPKGEAIHCDFKDSDFPYTMVLDELMNHNVGGNLVVESGADRCTDALIVMEYLNK